MTGLHDPPVLALERPKLDVKIFDERPGLGMEKRPGAEVGDVFGVAPPAGRAGRRVERDEAFEQMHVRILPVRRADGDLAYPPCGSRQALSSASPSSSATANSFGRSSARPA